LLHPGSPSVHRGGLHDPLARADHGLHGWGLGQMHQVDRPTHPAGVVQTHMHTTGAGGERERDRVMERVLGAGPPPGPPGAGSAPVAAPGASRSPSRPSGTAPPVALHPDIQQRGSCSPPLSNSPRASAAPPPPPPPPPTTAATASTCGATQMLPLAGSMPVTSSAVPAVLESGGIEIYATNSMGEVEYQDWVLDLGAKARNKLASNLDLDHVAKAALVSAAKLYKHRKAQYRYLAKFAQSP